MAKTEMGVLFKGPVASLVIRYLRTLLGFAISEEMMGLRLLTCTYLLILENV